MLPIREIVEQRRKERLHDNDKKETAAFMKTQQLKSVFADIQSSAKPESRGIGSV